MRINGRVEFAGRAKGEAPERDIGVDRDNLPAAPPPTIDLGQAWTLTRVSLFAGPNRGAVMINARILAFMCAPVQNYIT